MKNHKFFIQTSVEIIISIGTVSINYSNLLDVISSGLESYSTNFLESRKYDLSIFVK